MQDSRTDKTNGTIEKQLHSNYDTMNQVIRDQQQKIAERETEQGIQQNYKANQIPDEVETSRLEILNSMGEKIVKQDKEIKTYTQKITELEEKEETIKQLIQKNENDTTPSNIRIIV